MLLMQPILSVANVSKTYASGFRALERVNLDIRRGEIFALLGPNGAGKTTLISIICGIVTLTEGTVTVAGYDIGRDYRVTRSMIGVVQPRAVRQTAQSRLRRQGAQGAVAVGPEGQQDHDAVRRHEAPGVDRQGAFARAA